MELALAGGRIREWRPEDAASLARHADNRNIWHGAVLDQFLYAAVREAPVSP